MRETELIFILYLKQRPYSANAQYTYNNWSPPAQSNETSNGYFLERSHSARITLAKACELCPDDVSTKKVEGDLKYVAWPSKLPVVKVFFVKAGLHVFLNVL